MKPKTMILMVVAVGCGLVASYLTRQLIRAQTQTATPAEPMVQVLVAKEKVAPWVTIKDPDKFFKLEEYPERLVPRRAIKDVEQMKNQRLNRAVDANRPVTEEDLLNSEQAGLVAQMKDGERAVAFKVNAESLAGGFVLPGSRVDVICTTRGNDASTRAILQNMLVLAVDTQHQRNNEQSSILGQTVTLAAKPQEAARLALASSIGELRLTLRTPGDNRPLSKVEVKIADLARLPAVDAQERPSDTDPGPVASSASLVPALPALPADEPKEPVKEPVKEVAPAPIPEPVKPAVVKVKKHVLTIFQGATRERAVFTPGEKDEEESNEDDSMARPEARPEPKLTVKPTEPRPLLPPVPGATKPSGTSGGRSTRAGKIQ